MTRRGKLLTNLAALLFFLCACAAAPAQTRGDLTATPFSTANYRVGERLTYTVSFSNFPTAAHLELLVVGRGQYFGREGFELRAHVETLGVVSAALYPLNNSYITYVDAATGLPYRAQRVVREGIRVEDVTQDVNLAGGIIGTYDLLSALFRLRGLPLAQGATYPISVQHGTALYDAEVKVTGREVVKTNVGSSGAVVTQVRVRGNKEVDDYRLRAYFTEDPRHVPVLITARHRAGEVRAELASAEIVAEPAPPLAGTTPARPAQPGANLPPAAARPNTTPESAALPTLPFAPGEQLNFNFYLGATPQPIGTASFQVRARGRYFERDGLLLTTVIQTTGAGQALFPVNDQINSYVDAATLLPFRTELSLQEGQRRARMTVSLDQNGGSTLFDDGTRVEIPVGTHDLVSVFYAMRSFDLSPGRNSAVSLLINKRPRPLRVSALRQGTILLGGQQIPAVELALSTGDPAGDRFGLRLWVSTDRRRLPLRLTAQTPLGPVRADLAIIPTALQ